MRRLFYPSTSLPCGSGSMRSETLVRDWTYPTPTRTTRFCSLLIKLMCVIEYIRPMPNPEHLPRDQSVPALLLTSNPNQCHYPLDIRAQNKCRKDGSRGTPDILHSQVEHYVPSPSWSVCNLKGARSRHLHMRYVLLKWPEQLHNVFHAV